MSEQKCESDFIDDSDWVKSVIKPSQYFPGPIPTSRSKPFWIKVNWPRIKKLFARRIKPDELPKGFDSWEDVTVHSIARMQQK